MGFCGEVGFDDGAKAGGAAGGGDVVEALPDGFRQADGAGAAAVYGWIGGAADGPDVAGGRWCGLAFGGHGVMVLVLALSEG